MAVKNFGWDISKVNFNKNLFITIKPSGYGYLPEDLKDISITGKVLSDDESLSVSWESALEGNSVDNSLSTTSALMQSGTFSRLFEMGGKFVGKTMISEYESLQVFRGTEPLTLNVTLEFVAITDAYLEVELPIQYLYKMATPNLKEGLTEGAVAVVKKFIAGKGSIGDNVYQQLGDAPFMVTLDYLGKRFKSKYVLESISTSRDALKLTKDGYSIRREVNLSFKSQKAINREEVLIKTKV